MPLDASKLDELKSSIAFARKRPLAFGLCLGKAPETTILLTHKTKDPETVGRLAKKEGETTKLAFGMLTVESKNLNLQLQCDPIPGLSRKTREMLNWAGLKMKVRILDAAGNLLEEYADPEDEEDLVGDADVPGTPDPRKEEWDQTRPRVEAALAKAEAAGKFDLKTAVAAWQDAMARSADSDFAGAVKAAQATVQQISMAVQAATASEADRARWVAAAERLGPIIDGLAGADTPEVKNLLAYWSFAKSKATSTIPDFGAVMKVLPQVIKLITEIRSKMQMAPAEATSGGGKGSPGTTDGAPPVTADENARLAGLSDDDLLKADLTVGDTKALFSEDYMKKLKVSPTKGAGDPKLKDLMREVEKGPSGPRRGEVMQELAQIVGVPPTAEKLDDDYGRFLVVRKQQDAAEKKRGKEEVPALDEKMHPDFMASRSQLLFGKVLGDAFGIHEVFAALLSPTGGLVGPGNEMVMQKKVGVGPVSVDVDIRIKSGHLAPDNPVALHGTVHDAAGYLLNYHGEGPGYNYRDSKIEIFGTDDPFSGQVSGIAYWVKEAAFDEIEKKLKPIRDKAEAEIDRKIAQAKKTTTETVEQLRKLEAEVESKAVEIAEAIQEAPAKLERAAVEKLEEGKKKFGEMAEDAKRKLEAAWDFIWK